MEKLVPEPSFDGKAGAGFAAIRGRAWAPNEASAQEHSYWTWPIEIVGLPTQSNDVP